MDGSFGSLLQLAFPDANDAPSLSAQFSGDGTIARRVASNLLLPETRVRPRRKVSTAIVAMPEATVDEEGDALLAPGKVRTSQKSRVPSPA